MAGTLRIEYKIVSVILVLFMLLSAFPAKAASSDSGMCGPDLYWNYRDNILTVSGSGVMYDFVKKASSSDQLEIPWKRYATAITRAVIEEGCESVGNYAFSLSAALSEIVFPERSLKRIGNYAFSNSNKLIRVVIPDSVESLGEGAFSRCPFLKEMDLGSSCADIPQDFCYGNSSLETLHISENCRAVLNSAFLNCFSLSEVDLYRLETIDSFAFGGCALTRADFGPDLKYILTNAFSECSSLTEVTFADGADPVQVSNLFLNETPYYDSLPNGTYKMFDGKVLMNKGTYSKTALVVPDGVEIIADNAFYKSTSLKSVTFPESLKTIGAFAFRDCLNLKSVFIPSSVETLGTNCLGKYQSDLDYESYIDFVLHSKGNDAVMKYAAAECLQYVCDHDFERTVEIPDCTVGGESRLVCVWCGACVEKDPVAPTDTHDFEVITVPPTCTEEGFTLYRCRVCGYEERHDAEPALGHIPTGDWIVASLPDCAERGEIIRLCERCGGAGDVIPIERKQHTPSQRYERTAESTCTEPGLDVIKCTVCGEILSEIELSPLGHEPDATPVILTLPAEDGSLCGCLATVCIRCREVLDVTWIRGDGTTAEPHFAQAASRDALIGAICLENDSVNVPSVDFNSDGILSAKDLLEMRKLTAK